MSQQANNLTINSPQLPQQGGTIATVQTTPGHAGPTGDLQFSIPLPISNGRGFTPSLALQYQTAQGNSPFGVGWQLPLLSIRLHTKHGTPKYDDTDHYVGPSGEVLEPERDSDGNIVRNTRSTFGSKKLNPHEVIRYHSRVASGYERYERWQLISDSLVQIFWLVFEPDGTLHCLGKSPLSQTSDKGRIAEWSIEESLSPHGEHIHYVYKAENNDGIAPDQLPENVRSRGALSYLTQVFYGNVVASSELYCWSDTKQDEEHEWLFSLIFDYGQRSLDANLIPQWSATTNWLARQDPFSDYNYGFEVRCHRICHQVLMFHHFPDELTEQPMLVRRLILDYNQNPILSRLQSAQVWAYGVNSENQTIVESHPALLLGYQDFTLPAVPQWQTLGPTPGIDDAPFYQLVDLYGEGLPGVLFRSGTDWRYSSPRRGCEHNNAITYSDWCSVPSVPSLQNDKQVLTDITGDGRLDWIVLQPGLNGFFTLNDDQTWQSFTPFSAVPSELLNGEGVFANITGAGLSDVAVIGPNSVRFYPNIRQGFSQGEQTALNALNAPLPMLRHNERTLVAFGDVLGSGQSHLIEITEKTVHCWPNLGRGEFGDRIEFDWLWSGDCAFQPHRLYMVDLDGSGADSLVYVHSDKITLYKNLSGNGFESGKDISLPEGVGFDDTCQLTFADLQASGGMSVLLSVPHMAPAHYVLPLTAHKPYLISQLDNQCGAISQVTYRHSGQEWLDEKAGNDNATCSLPMSVYLVKKITQIDQVTGNTLTQNFTYRHGVYDGIEREYRGFGYVETTDTEHLVALQTDTHSPALKTCRWYHVGNKKQTASYWQGDDKAYTLKDTYVDGWEPSKSELWWIDRALVGTLQREEVYGLDLGLFQATPYTVQSIRYQIIRKQFGLDGIAAPALMMAPVEQLSYDYERISADPSCQHTLTLAFDDYGLPKHAVAINYPRRAVKNEVWTGIYSVSDQVDVDEQQFVLRLNESLNAYLQEETDTYSVIGLPFESRSNVIEGQEKDVPTDGFNVEFFKKNPRIVTNSIRHFAGQQKRYYIQNNELVGFSYPPRVVHVETAVLDDVALKAYEEVLTADQLITELNAAGYLFVPRIQPSRGERGVWVAPQSYTRYLGAEDFYLPVASRTTTLVGESQVTYDKYHLAVTSMKDAANNITTATVNYQQLLPHTLTDLNKNTQQVAVSPLGVPVNGSFYGTEKGTKTGFPPLINSITTQLHVATLIEEAGTTIQQEASLFACDEFSWQSEVPIPLHQVVLTADTYPDIKSQQVQVKLAYSDGFGRALQNLQKVAPGLAYQRTEEGELAVDGNDKLIEAHTETRWQVSGRVEYNNKGQVVRQYQPYFVDDWHYITNTAMRAQGYADTHYYDALGREIKVVTAKGFERRHYYTPWFTVAEDENDTWSEVSPSH